MKSLTLSKIKEPLQLLEQQPLVAGANEIVVDLKAAALNRRDYWITQGMYPGIDCPVVLGSDGAGIIATGSDGAGAEVIINPGWNWGDNDEFQSSDFRILGMPDDGTFANQVVVPKSYVHAKPSHLGWAQASAIPLAGVTAYRALFRQGYLESGEIVLINGIGGGVATFALQFAIAAGARVWVTSSSDQKIQSAMDLGASGGVNYKADDWSRQLPDAPNLIIDSAGGSGYNELLSVAAPGGRIVSYGSTTGAPEKLDFFKVFWKQLTLQGSTMGSPADFQAMLSFVEKHQIQPIVDRVFPLADGNEAISQMKKSPQFGKYVLEIDG